MQVKQKSETKQQEARERERDITNLSLKYSHPRNYVRIEHWQPNVENKAETK